MDSPMSAGGGEERKALWSTEVEGMTKAERIKWWEALLAWLKEEGNERERASKL